MKLITCSLIVLTVLVAQSASLSPWMIQAGLDTALKQIAKTKINIPSINMSIPKGLQEYIIGDLNLTDFSVYGLETFAFKDAVAKLQTDRGQGFTRNGISVNTSLDTIGLETEYVWDMNLLDIVPLYGKGKFRIGLTKIVLDVHLNLYDKFSKNFSAEDLDIKLKIRHSSDSEVTGFWDNVEVSALITNVINIVEPFVCMFYDYEQECLDCVVSKVAQILVNMLLGAATEDLIKCECLGELSFLNKLSIPSLVSSWQTGDYVYIKENIIRNPDVHKVYNRLYSVVSKVVIENFENMNM